ncbi:MAG: hypothetical protein Q8O47_09085 [Candidatus Bathyarchaeota archaeon]|nr:hypothetical protein [Candidatus Bathyarchaeota archaeon]
MVCTLCFLRRINDIRNAYEDMMVDLRKVNNWVKKRWRLGSQLPAS